MESRYTSMQTSSENSCLKDKDMIFRFLKENRNENLCFSTNVKGNSMFPTIKNGETVCIHTCCIPDIAIGDVISFYLRDRFIIHRVVKIRKGGAEKVFITKGDFRFHGDPAVSEGNIIGKVASVSKKDRTMLAEDWPYCLSSGCLGFISYCICRIGAPGRFLRAKRMNVIPLKIADKFFSVFLISLFAAVIFTLLICDNIHHRLFIKRPRPWTEPVRDNKD